MGNMKKEIYFFFFLNILTRGSACLKHATFIVVFAVEGGKGYISDKDSRVVGPSQSLSVFLKITDWFRGVFMYSPSPDAYAHSNITPERADA